MMTNIRPNDFRLALKSAFPRTLPVIAGYSILGIAFGVLMQGIGLGVGWTFLTSLLIFAGSMQYAAVLLFSAPFNPLYALALTLMVNARHIFYGLSMLDRLKSAGKFKWYTILTLTDETFSLFSTEDGPEGARQDLHLFLVSLLCRWYWIIASVLGALAGQLLQLSPVGLDFALTAMFIVILLEHWEKRTNRVSLLIGSCSTLFFRIILGPQTFLIPAMVLILTIFALFGKKLTEGVRQDG